jgi:predicted small secreted protein
MKKLLFIALLATSALTAQTNTLTGANTIVSSTYTSLNSAQTFVNGQKLEVKTDFTNITNSQYTNIKSIATIFDQQGTNTTISKNGISTAGSVTAAKMYTQGLDVGNEIINLKNSVNTKASANDVTNLTNRVTAVNDRLSGQVARIDQQVVRLDGQVQRIDGLVAKTDATNAKVNELTNTVAANKVEAKNYTDAETARAKAAEKALDNKIDLNAETAKLYTDKETTRALDAESKLGKRIDALEFKFDQRINGVLSYVSSEFAAVNNRIEGLGAMTVALSAAATSSVYNANKPTNLNIATGVYGNATAIAVGMSHFFNSSTKVSVNWSQGSNTKNAVGIGCGIAF